MLGALAVGRRPAVRPFKTDRVAMVESHFASGDGPGQVGRQTCVVVGGNTVLGRVPPVLGPARLFRGVHRRIGVPEKIAGGGGV